MSVKERIQEDMKAAMKAREKDRLSCIRMLMAAMKQVEVDRKIELEDRDVVEIVVKMIKQRTDAVKIYEDNGEADKALAEKREIEWLEAYLPKKMSEDEIKAKIDAAIASTGAKDQKDMGKVMAVLKSELLGVADLGVVSGMVKKALS